MAHNFTLSSSVLTNGRTVHYAKLSASSESKFIIGYRTRYDGNYGLYNTVDVGHVYKPEDFSTQFGFWAYFIFPTAKGESQGLYNCLNSYDRAKFTFGYMQYAAHVPNGDFVTFLKRLLSLPRANDYFPRLLVQNNRIFYKSDQGVMTQLENDDSTQALMNYFNPTLNDVETQELICSARMVHWAINDVDHRIMQAETAINHFKVAMVEYDNRFGLDQVPARICQMICDIRHQGRGNNNRIANALDTSGDYKRAFANLCSIGSANYQSRINTVRNTINRLEAEGLFSKKYDRGRSAFIDI